MYGVIMDIKYIIRDYKKRKLCKALAELDEFRTLSTLDECINNAGLAIHQNGKKYRHQFRISKKTLSIARDILLAHKKAIKKTRNFGELIVLVGCLLESVKGIGELYIYDTSLRIGSYLGYLPEKVYLHSGTRKGARKLGFKNKYVIEMNELPKEFQQLDPFEVEDILCIYKKKFASMKKSKSDNCE
jgi:hypothetical protein